MMKCIVLLVSFLSSFFPALGREKAQEQMGLGKILTESKRQMENALFSRLKNLIHPGNFEKGSDYTGMRFMN